VARETSVYPAAVHTGDIDGIPVLWQPGGGRLTAGLMFRVGRADEQAARCGITHLVEHLVLHTVDGAAQHQFNGMSGTLTTTFLAAGDEREIRTFLTGVCTALRDLPLERLSTEIELLGNESRGRRSSAADQLAFWRHGAATYGLAGGPEQGLGELSGDEVQQWARGHFTRQNAALWLAGGPPPDDLRLDLPDGEYLPAPAASSALPDTPAYFESELDGVAFNGVVPWTPAAQALAAVLRHRLHRVLRREGGISYATDAAVEPYAPGQALVTAVADSAPRRHAELVRGFLDTVLDLATEPVPGAELAEVLHRLDGHGDLDQPSVDELAGRCQRMLLRLPAPNPGALGAVTAQQVLDAARQILATGLIAVPRGQAVGRAGFVPAPTGSSATLAGRTHRLRHQPDAKPMLISAPEGVSLIDGLHVATVRYADCVALQVWPDGARRLDGADGIAVHVEPQLWDDGARVIDEIDAAVPAGRTIHRPARRAERIPQPPPAPPLAQRVRRMSFTAYLLLILSFMAVAGIGVGVFVVLPVGALSLGALVGFTVAGVYGIVSAGRARKPSS
jgi:zinc protease